MDAVINHLPLWIIGLELGRKLHKVAGAVFYWLTKSPSQRADAVLVFQNFGVWFKHLNQDVFSKEVPVLVALGCLISVMANYGLIKGREDMPVYIFCLCPIVVACAFWYFVLIPKAIGIYEAASMLIEDYNRTPHNRFGKRKAKALQLCYIGIETFGRIDQQFLLKFLSQVVGKTVDAVIVL